MSIGPAAPEPERAGTAILLLLETFHPIVGGGETHARLLAAEFVRLGAKPVVVTRRRTPDMPRRELVDGVPVIRVGPTGLPRLGKYLMLLTALPVLIRERHAYDAVYVCGLRVLGSLGVGVGRLLRKPCILRSEAQGELSGEFALREVSGSLVRRVIRGVVRVRNRLLRRATAYVAISDVIRQEYEAQGVPFDRIWMIPNGVDTERFRPAEPSGRMSLRQELGLPDSDLLVVYTGKLIRGKGLESLLRVWASLCEDWAGLHLALVGGGGLQALSREKELRAFVDRNGLAEAVTFTGYVTDVERYLQAADAFVLPSESEAFPLSILEAMACGLAVIGSRTGGILEVVNDGANGLLVPIGNDVALERALRLVLTDREMARELGEQARADVEARYGIARVAREHLARFARVVLGA